MEYIPVKYKICTEENTTSQTHLTAHLSGHGANRFKLNINYILQAILDK